MSTEITTKPDFLTAVCRLGRLHQKPAAGWHDREVRAHAKADAIIALGEHPELIDLLPGLAALWPELGELAEEAR